MTWLAFLGDSLSGDHEGIPWSHMVGTAFLALVALGVVLPSLNAFGETLLKVQTPHPHVALTFDDGPDATHTRHVLAILTRRRAAATFFLVGARARLAPELVRDLHLSGHQVENHSWSHAPWLPAASTSHLSRELSKTSDLIEAMTGRRPRWFRPPVGLVSPPLARSASRVGLTLCGWSVSARDGVRWRSPERALRKLRRHLEPGAILVLHDAPGASHYAPAVTAYLEALLDEIEARGLVPVTLDTLVAGSSAPRIVHSDSDSVPSH